MIEEPLAPAEPAQSVQEEPRAVPLVRSEWVWRWIVPLVIFGAFCSLYLSTHTRWYTFDSVAYATRIRQFKEVPKASYLVHPHHLLFNSVGYVFWRGLEAVNIKVSSLEATQMMNSVIGALLLALFYRMLVTRGFRLRAPPPALTRWPIVEIAATLCLGATFGFWAISTDGRVNAPALLMLTLAIGYAWGAIDNLRSGQVVLCALFSVLAVAFHQSHGLMIAFVVACILLALAPQRKRFRFAIGYLVGTGVGIAAIYLVLGSMAAGKGSLGELLQWALIYSEDGRWWKLDFWNNFVDLNTKAYTQAFVAAPPTLTEGTLELWQADLLQLLRDAVLPAAMVIVAIGLVYVFVSVIRDRMSTGWRMILALAAFAIPYITFFTVWDPGYWVFWIPLTLITLAVLPLATHKAPWWIRLPVAVVLLAWAGASMTANAHATFLRRTDVAVNPELVALRSISGSVRPGDMMLTTGIGSGAKFEVYAPYFANLSVSVGHMELKRADGDFDRAKASIRAKIEAAVKNGNRAYIAREYYVPEQWAAVGKRYTLPSDPQAQILEGYDRIEVPTGSVVRLFYLVPMPVPRVKPNGWFFSSNSGTPSETPRSK